MAPQGSKRKSLIPKKRFAEPSHRFTGSVSILPYSSATRKGPIYKDWKMKRGHTSTGIELGEKLNEKKEDEKSVLPLTTSCDAEMPSCSSNNMDNMEEPVDADEDWEMSDDETDENVPVDEIKAEKIDENEASFPCQICGKDIKTRSLMTKHLKSHHKQGDLKCKVCQKELSSRSSLDRHFLIHSSERPHRCPECSRRFTTNGNMHRHRKTTHSDGARELPQSLPDDVGNPEASGTSHETAGSSQSNEAPDDEHVKEAASPLKEALGVSEVSSPPDTAPPEDPNSPDKPIKKQPRKATRSANKAAILPSNESVRRSNRSKKRAASPSESQPAKKAAETDAPKPAKLNKAKPKKDDTPPPFAFQFPFSSSKFPMLANTKEAKDTMPRPDTPVFRCSACDQVFFDLEALTRHQASHREPLDSDFFCPVCRVTHGSFCEFASHRMKLDPTPDAPEDSSQSRFLSQFKLFRHPPAERVDEAGPDDNSNDFADIGSIVSNVSSSAAAAASSSPEQSGDPPRKKGKFQCQECEYSSNDKSTLTRHMVTHTNEHPFICTFRSGTDEAPCAQKFTLKSNGERHARKIHRLDKKSLAGVIEYNSASGPQEEIECPNCHKRFVNAKARDHHLRSPNSGCTKKPFQCGKCGTGFATKHNFVRHFSLHRDGLSKESFEKEKAENCIVIQNTANGSPQKEPQSAERRRESCNDVSASTSSNEDEENAVEAVRVSSECEENPDRISSPQSERREGCSDITASTSDSSNREEDDAVEKVCDPSHPDRISSPAMDDTTTGEDQPLDLTIHPLDLRHSPFEMPAREGRPSLSDERSRIARGFYLDRPRLRLTPSVPSIASQPLNLSPYRALFGGLNARILQTADDNAQQDSKRRRLESFGEPSNTSRVLQTTDDNVQQQQQQLPPDNNKRLGQEDRGQSDSENNNDLASVRSMYDTANAMHFQYWITPAPQQAREDNSFRCDLCPRSFSYSSALIRHRTSHTGERPHKCRICSKRFANKSNLLRHVRTLHGGERRQSPSNDRIESHENSSDAAEDHAPER